MTNTTWTETLSPESRAALKVVANMGPRIRLTPDQARSLREWKLAYCVYFDGSQHWHLTPRGYDAAAEL